MVTVKYTSKSPPEAKDSNNDYGPCCGCCYCENTSCLTCCDSEGCSVLFILCLFLILHSSVGVVWLTLELHYVIYFAVAVIVLELAAGITGSLGKCIQDWKLTFACGILTSLAIVRSIVFVVMLCLSMDEDENSENRKCIIVAICTEVVMVVVYVVTLAFAMLETVAIRQRIREFQEEGGRGKR